jgi:hypothetical protein
MTEFNRSMEQFLVESRKDAYINKEIFSSHYTSGTYVALPQLRMNKDNKNKTNK